jgi:hypothetical protein
LATNYGEIGRLCLAQSIELFWSPAVQTIYFILAVAVVSTIIFALSTRADRARRASSDGGSSDPGVSATNDGWVASWFGPTHSSDITGSWDGSSSWSGGDIGGGDPGGGGRSSD